MAVLPPLPLLVAFCIASIAMSVMPGPGVFYIVTRSLAQGRAAGLASVAGVALGNLTNALGAAIGLAALFAVSSLAFTVVKYAGAAYLVYLGVKALRQRGELAVGPFEPVDRRRILRDGFVVALLNPKTALFFAAFLPQFMSQQASALGQSVVLGTTFVLIAASTDSIYALACSAVAPRLVRSPGGGRAGRWLSASAYFGLGVFTAVTGSRPA